MLCCVKQGERRHDRSDQTAEDIELQMRLIERQALAPDGQNHQQNDATADALPPGQSKGMGTVLGRGFGQRRYKTPDATAEHHGEIDRKTTLPKWARWIEDGAQRKPLSWWTGSGNVPGGILSPHEIGGKAHCMAAI
jgi:hypothetical protein